MTTTITLERLAEIEARASTKIPGDQVIANYRKLVALEADASALVAEVRRLRDKNAELCRDKLMLKMGLVPYQDGGLI